MGGAEVIWGGSTTVNLALSTCAFPPLDEFGESACGIPLPTMVLLMGWQVGDIVGKWGRRKVVATGGAHRDTGVVMAQ
jgi:hypothetical protein